MFKIFIDWCYRRFSSATTILRIAQWKNLSTSLKSNTRNTLAKLLVTVMLPPLKIGTSLVTVSKVENFAVLNDKLMRKRHGSPIMCTTDSVIKIVF